MTEVSLPAGVITFLFTDIQGSTPLWEQNPTGMEASLAQHNEIMHQAVAEHGGQVYKTIGDEFQSVFTIPLNGLLAALAAQRALAAASWGSTGPIRVRMGLHLGHATPEGGDYITTHTQNRVARIMSAGHGGQILLSGELAGLVRSIVPAGVGLRDLGQHRLKGMQALEHIFQVTAPDLTLDFPPLNTLGTADRIAGRYERQQVIGQGGMGTVYRGLDVNTGRSVAIKALNPAVVAKDPDLITRFIREGEALRQLNHPNIVKMLAAAEENGHHFIIMEHVEGGDLRQLIDAGAPIPLDRCLNIALDLADALTRAHRLGIIHRDLKPANVLIAADGTPRLTDFGIAHVGGQKEVLTQQGMVIGTLTYLSPEACQGMALDERTDIWSFGVLLYEMLTGRRPFGGESLAGTLISVLNDPLPDIGQQRPDLPPGLSDLLAQMLTKDRDARIPSVRLVGAELEALLRGGTVATGTWTTSGVKRAGTETKTETGEAPVVQPAPAPVEAVVPGQPAKAALNHNLPNQAHPFIGREAELAALDNFLTVEQTRLVTIVGPGGMGKTSLALAWGERLTRGERQLSGDRYPHGLYFIDLAPLSSAAQIVSALADALGFSLKTGGGEDRSPQQQILDYLRQKRMLLIFDNFEHVLDGVDLIAAILPVAPGVQILATSRERLHVGQEQVYPISGLEFPDWDSPADALKYTAVILFQQSARRNDPSFIIGEADLAFLTRICRAVQGTPLAIELAAAWVDTLSLAEIAAEIQQSLDFLETESRTVTERHRSMRAVFDYSWQLLAEQERETLAALSIFRGGFDRPAAAAVAGATLRGLSRLVNKSLLQYDKDKGRYGLHALLNQYGAEKLAQDKAHAADLRRKHAIYYAEWIQEQAAKLSSREEIETLHAFDVALDNILVAWEHLVAEQALAPLTGALNGLSEYFMIRERNTAGRDACAQVLDICTPPTTDSAKLAFCRATVWYMIFDGFAGREEPYTAAPLQQVNTFLTELAETQSALQKEQALLHILNANLDAWAGLNSAVIEHVNQAMALSLQANWIWGISFAAWYVAFQHVGDLWQSQGEGMIRAALAAARAAGSKRTEHQIVARLLRVAVATANHSLIAAYYGQFEALSRENQPSVDVLENLDTQFELARLRGEMKKAQQIRLEIQAHREELGMPANGLDAALLGQGEAHLGDYDASVERLQRVLRQISDDEPHEGLIRIVLGMTLIALNRLPEAETVVRQALAINQQNGHKNAIAGSMANLALVYTLTGRQSEARPMVLTAMRYAYEHYPDSARDYLGVIEALSATAVALAAVDLAKAAAAHSLLQMQPYYANSMVMQDMTGRRLTELTRALDPEAAAAAQAWGQSHTIWTGAAALIAELEALGWAAEL